MNKLLPGFVQPEERKTHQSHHFLGAFAKLLRHVYPSVHPSVRPTVNLSACNNSTHAGRASVQLDIRVFFQSLLRKPNFSQLGQE